MKIGKIITLLVVVSVLGYLIFLAVGMSSTVPPLKKYTFKFSAEDFEYRLKEAFRYTEGWKIAKTDRVRASKDHICYWASVAHRDTTDQISYLIKYCSQAQPVKSNQYNLELFIVGAFDETNRTGGYKNSDKDVSRLIQYFDERLNGAAK